MKACALGDVAAVLEALEDGVDVNTTEQVHSLQALQGCPLLVLTHHTPMRS